MSSDSSNPTRKPFSFSHTKLSIYRRCLQQYHWKYVDGFYPPSSPGQARGTAGHAALAIWHRSYNEQEALDKAWEVWELNNQQPGPDWQLLQDSLERYFEWSKTNRDDFEIIESEQEFQIEFEVSPYWLPDRKKKMQPYSSVILTGFIDGIVRDKGYLWLLENKFYKRMDNSPLDLDAQVSTYLLASGILDLGGGEPIQGVIYNTIRVADTKIAITEPVVRRKLHRSLGGLEYIQSEILTQVDRMIQHHNGGVPYRNATKDCHWDCPFYSACLLLTDDGQAPTDQLISLSQTRSTKNGTKEETTEEQG